MKNKKQKILITSICSFGVVLTAVAASALTFTVTRAANANYTFAFASGENVLNTTYTYNETIEVSTNIETRSHSPVEMEYLGLKKTSDSWQKMSGFVEDPENPKSYPYFQTNTPIKGFKSLIMAIEPINNPTSANALYIYYSKNKDNFSNDHCTVITDFSSTDPVKEIKIDIKEKDSSGNDRKDDYNPYYFKVAKDGKDELKIYSMTWYINCVDSDPRVYVDVPEGYDQGQILGEGQYAPNSEVTLKAIPDDGYLFTGWRNIADNSWCYDETYTFDMPLDTETFVAFFAPAHSITYHNVDGATNPNPTQYHGYVDVKLTSATKSGFNFLGWRNNNEGTGDFISTISAGTSFENIDLYAYWEYSERSITYTNVEVCNNPNGYIPNKGDVIVLNDGYSSDKHFHHWEDATTHEVVEQINPFKETTDITLEAVYIETDTNLRKEYGFDSKYNDDINKVTFGLYPQNFAATANDANDPLGVELDKCETDENGYVWYKYNGERKLYYAYNSQVSYDDKYFSHTNCKGEKVKIEEKKYYFFVEPISWDYFQTTLDPLRICSTDIIDASIFDNEDCVTFENNTRICNTLNYREFYKRAFAINGVDKDLIYLSKPDDDAWTNLSVWVPKTYELENWYVDKGKTRRKHVSDFAISRDSGCYVIDGVNCCKYWTCSYYSDRYNTRYLYYVKADGDVADVTSMYVDNVYGVVPVIKLTKKM